VMQTKEAQRLATIKAWLVSRMAQWPMQPKDY